MTENTRHSMHPPCSSLHARTCTSERLAAWQYPLRQNGLQHATAWGRTLAISRQLSSKCLSSHVSFSRWLAFAPTFLPRLSSYSLSAAFARARWHQQNSK